MSEEINASKGGRTERRRYPRLNTSVQVELIVEDPVAPIRTKTDEIALGGCYIEAMFTLPIYGLDNPQVGNGIEFADLRAEAQARVTRFLAERQAQQQTSATE